MAVTALASQLSGTAAAAPKVSVVATRDELRTQVRQALASEGLIADDDGRPEMIVVADDAPRSDIRTRLQELQELNPDVQLVVVAADDRAASVQTALRCGAVGFVPYERLLEALGPCVRAVIAGQLSVPQERRAELQKPALTAREKQALALVVMGLRNCEIAKQLFLAESTVKSHLSSAFAKLGVRSRNEAAALILDPRAGLGTGILTIPNGETYQRP